MFDFLKIYMASEFKGTLLNNGSPVTNTKISRIIQDGAGGKEKLQETITDDQGRFNFDAVTAHSPSKLLPFEMRFFQEISTGSGDEKVKLFYMTKSNTAHGGEFSRFDENRNFIPTSMNFVCELTNEDEILTYAKNEYLGVCRIVDNLTHPV